MVNHVYTTYDNVATLHHKYKTVVFSKLIRLVQLCDTPSHAIACEIFSGRLVKFTQVH